MRSKIIITIILIASFIGLLSLANGIKKDSANLEYIPSFTADATPASIKIEGLDNIVLSSEGRAFTEDALYDYQIKYEPSPKNNFQTEGGNTAKGAVDDNGIVTTSFFITNGSERYKVVYRTDPDIWIDVTVTNVTTNESYSNLKNISASSF
jgi:hypothetical protein